MNDHPALTFEELCILVDLPPRTIRYYIQTGLVDRPDGLNRGARYTARHVDQLLSVKKWQAAGLSLGRIGELLHDDGAEPPPRRKAPGAIEVWSRLQVAHGIELQVEAGEAGLTPEQLRALFRSVLQAYQDLRNEAPDNKPNNKDNSND
jgi:DNA-binding transcriptional MerR regulator